MHSSFATLHVAAAVAVAVPDADADADAAVGGVRASSASPGFMSGLNCSLSTRMLSRTLSYKWDNELLIFELRTQRHSKIQR